MQMAADILLSVVVRVRNESKSLKRLFEALQAQRCVFGWEVIVVDNESEEREIQQICQEFKARVVSIRRDEFTYGRALNLGISQARGDLVLLVSAHALPIGANFLENCVAPFQDPLMGAVRCLSVFDHEQLAQWYKPKDIQYASPEEQKAAEVGRRWTRDYPAATCAVIRRTAWELVHFDETLESAEDKAWASEILKRGFKVRRCAEAVFLTRELEKMELWRRQHREYLGLYRISGYVRVRWSTFLIKIVKAIIAAPGKALEHIVDTVLENWYLVIIPWKARTAPKSGSLAEFDKRAD